MKKIVSGGVGKFVSMVAALCIVACLFFPVVQRIESGLVVARLVPVCAKSGMMPTRKCPKVRYMIVPVCWNSWLWRTPCILHPE